MWWNSQWRIGRTNDYFYVCNADNLLTGSWEVASFQANPKTCAPLPRLLPEAGIAWRGGFTQASCGVNFEVRFELGPLVPWATEWQKGAYVELRKAGEEECLDYYRLHEQRQGGFEWQTPVTEPGVYCWVLRSSGDPFPPQYAAQEMEFVLAQPECTVNNGGVLVDGAGCGLVNGFYSRNGDYSGHPFFTNRETGLEIWWNGQWRLGQTNDYYYVSDSEEFTGDWRVASFQANQAAVEPPPMCMFASDTLQA